MLPEIMKAYKDGRLMLLLGAGASYGSQSRDGQELPMSEGLAKELAQLTGLDYQDETLDEVYAAINHTDSVALHEFLGRRLTNTKPSHELNIIASYPWSRIFTLNIDDCTEVALRAKSQQAVEVYGRNSNLKDPDPIFDTVQLIKLNGSADRPEDGFIFSPQEYGEGSNRLPSWYRELGRNYSDYVFVMIGSKLKEPLFQHAIAQERSFTERKPLQGYVITPEATAIQKLSLQALNLIHVRGTLKDFAEWLEREIPKRPTGWDLTTARRPELLKYTPVHSEAQKCALNSVDLVGADAFPYPLSDNTLGAIRKFYQGYKPSWKDIREGVPANLTFINNFIQIIQENTQEKKCIVLVGVAGSGKTTALMISALHLSTHSGKPVYFLREAIGNLKEIVVGLEELNSSGFYLFIDKIESMREQIVEVLTAEFSKNICIIASERLNIWNRRISATLNDVVSKVFKVEKITQKDAKLILRKLEKFGPWTRLQKMAPQQRLDEIYRKADRQLLIGLMEATTGLGFAEIIRRDFMDLGDDNHKKFMIVVGLATIHRTTISSNILKTSLSNLRIKEGVNLLANETEGIVVIKGKKYSARHPIYVRELFEKIAPIAMIKECLIAVLEAFSDYGSPVALHVAKVDSLLFKSIINHRFLKVILRNDEAMVLSVYEAFERRFHVDGLYWLQYGLALRTFDRQLEALEKLKTAREAYFSSHIEHAYAQQLMIIASDSLDWDTAKPLLGEATTILEAFPIDTDTYPIVTLAEGSISVFRKFLTDDTINSASQRFVNKLFQIYSKYPSDRLKLSIDRINSFLTSGKWDDVYGAEYLSDD